MITKFIVPTVIAALLLTGAAVVLPEKTDSVQPAVAVSAETGPEQTAAETTAVLTAEDAKSIALTHAGLTADEVTQLRSEIDRENGIRVWDVEFRSGDWEFDYAIHAETGQILKGEKEYDPLKSAPAPTEAVPAEPDAALTAADAQAIALAHAGFTADAVTRLRTEYDFDDGVPEFEVEFRVGGVEYEYEIHAETGAILSWEKERDD